MTGKQKWALLTGLGLQWVALRLVKAGARTVEAGQWLGVWSMARMMRQTAVRPSDGVEEGAVEQHVEIPHVKDGELTP